MTILDQLRDWLRREGQRWKEAGERAQVYRLKSNVLVYLLSSKKIGWWGLNPNVVKSLRSSGGIWKAVFVSVNEGVAFVVNGNSDLIESLTPSKRGYYLPHERTELKNSEKLTTLAEIMGAVSADSPAESSPRVRESRKYGPGGEGPDHKKLKEWILHHPEDIGLHGVSKSHLEYEFLTGDRVDLLFHLEGDRFAVVEIETDNPLPGAFQALKYKVLKCAEIGSDIKSSKVEAILVAWGEPEDRGFCQSYNVRFVKKRL
jgi:hypothetical protein